MWRRKLVSSLFVAFCAAAVLVALVPLVLVLFFVVSQGVRALNLDFFRHLPAPVGEPGGGMANAMVGTLMLTGLGSLLAIPIGVLSGVYMSEFAGTRFASAIRFAADTLNGVPSIVIGVFAYGVAVLPFKQFSALAGALALGIMMIPIIARTTEELLLLVPGTMREGALALGATRARAVFTVVLPAAAPGIVTGIVLALARIAGETAPLLFTSFNNRFFSTNPTQPISSLTVQIFTYAISPYEEARQRARALVEEHSAGRALLRVNMSLRPTSAGTVTAAGVAVAVVAATSAGLALRWPLAGLVASAASAKVGDAFRRLGRKGGEEQG